MVMQNLTPAPLSAEPPAEGGLTHTRGTLYQNKLLAVMAQKFVNFFKFDWRLLIKLGAKGTNIVHIPLQVYIIL